MKTSNQTNIFKRWFSIMDRNT